MMIDQGYSLSRVVDPIVSYPFDIGMQILDYARDCGTGPTQYARVAGCFPERRPTGRVNMHEFEDACCCHLFCEVGEGGDLVDPYLSEMRVIDRYLMLDSNFNAH